MKLHNQKIFIKPLNSRFFCYYNLIHRLMLAIVKDFV